MTDTNLNEKINELSRMEQNLQYLSSQRQSFQNQKLEADSALEELETSDESFKIIGNIMVKTYKDKIKKDLEEKKKIINIRIESIEKQEKSLKKKSQELRDEVMKGFENEKK